MDHALAADLAGRGASELAAAVRRRSVSPVEVVQAHLDRIAALDGALGAFEAVDARSAIAQARALTSRSDLVDLPLAGVPVAIKDNIDVAGLPTRHGSAATSGATATRDDELVRRLRAGGCVVIGKTRMCELAVWPFTEPEAFGAARNPWDPALTPGGSTGGGAVAVATGMVPLALGTDGGGSLRVPASCCGVLGLKPGPGLVPLPGEASSHWLGLTEAGPLASTADDLASMLDVLAGTARFRERAATTRRLRLALSLKAPTVGARVDRRVAEAVRHLAAILSEAGHEIVPADPPYPVDLGLRFMRRWLPGISEDARGLPAERLERRTRAMAAAGGWIARRGWATRADADGLGRAMTRWLAPYDALITPTLTTPPVPIGRWRGKGWIATTLSVANWVSTTPWNLAGFPAASVPAGRTSDGIPIGAQLVARPGREDVLLDLIARIEALRPWPRWTPKDAKEAGL